MLENRPYAGSIVPADSYGRDPRVCSVMIEVNRALYINETSGERSAGFDGFKLDLEQVLKLVAEAWSDEKERAAISEPRLRVAIAHRAGTLVADDETLGERLAVHVVVHDTSDAPAVHRQIFADQQHLALLNEVSRSA